MNDPALAPIVKTLELRASAEKAFRHYTANIHLWWPLASHSLSLGVAETVVFEAQAGGRIYEVDNKGREREWGRVLECEPPRRILHTWVLESPDKATEIEIQFIEKGESACAMTLIHRGWENRPDGAEWRGNYDTGWNGVLARYTETLS